MLTKLTVLRSGESDIADLRAGTSAGRKEIIDRESRRQLEE